MLAPQEIRKFVEVMPLAALTAKASGSEEMIDGIQDIFLETAIQAMVSIALLTGLTPAEVAEMGFQSAPSDEEWEDIEADLIAEYGPQVEGVLEMMEHVQSFLENQRDAGEES